MAAGNIVIQGVSDPLPLLDQLIRLSGCSSHARIKDQAAFRFHDGQLNSALQAFCIEHQLDCACVPYGFHPARFGLVAFDMDSTLISIETIDELSVIAGVRAQIAPLTESAMRGEIDFESSFRQRIALLGNLPVSAMDEVYEEKLRLNPGAERLITTLKNYGVKTALITSGFEYFAEKLRSWLTLDIAVYNRIGIRDGHFTGQIDGMLIDAAGKAKALEDCKKALGLRREQIIAIGDGANDLAMLGMAGTSVAYHAKPVIREKTTYALDYVGLDGLLNLFEKH